MSERDLRGLMNEYRALIVKAVRAADFGDDPAWEKAIDEEVLLRQRIVDHLNAKGSCGLFHCPLEEARKLLPDLPWDEAPVREGVEYIADVKVHMLMPGQWPCIPAWHQDFVPRDPETLEERPEECDPAAPPMLMWLSGPPLTEFKDQGISRVPAKTWVEFTQFDEHRGVSSEEHCWRTFIRLTPIEVMRAGLPHQEIPAPREQWVRRHTQVYLDSENFKW